MPRLDNLSTAFYNQLSAELQQEPVSPEQIREIADAVASLPQNARLTKDSIEQIAVGYKLPAPHRATLTFALLMHRYGAKLQADLNDPNAMANGLAGLLNGLLQRARHAEGENVASLLHQFFVSFAGPRAPVEESGLEIFQRVPALVWVGEAHDASVHAAVPQNVMQQLSPEIRERLGFAKDFAGQGNVELGSFVQDKEWNWAFQPMKPAEGKRPKDLSLEAIGVQALEHLAQGLAQYINARPQNQHVDPATAMLIARDVGTAGSLLDAVLKTLETKNAHLTTERTEREQELRAALGEYRVQRIGAETVNALVSAFFPKAEGAKE